MGKFLQEKIQIILPVKEQVTAEWKTPESARRVSQPNLSSQMPTGQDLGHDDIENWRDGGLAGQTSVTDNVTHSIRNGYTRAEMKPYDDQYTGEGIDLFYGEACGEDGVGFMERNNYLDRI